MQYAMVALKDIRPHKIYSAHDVTVRVLAARIKKAGFLAPIVVGTGNYILDGDKRYAALVALHDPDWRAPIIRVDTKLDPLVVRTMLNARLSPLDESPDSYIDPYIDAIRAAFTAKMDLDVLIESDASFSKRTALEELKEMLREEDAPWT